MMRTLVALVMLAAPAWASTRLDPAVVPSHYDVTLAPDLVARTFSGHVDIAVKIASPHAQIELNAVGETIGKASVNGVAARIEMLPELQRVRLVLPKPVVGDAKIALDFSAPLSQRLTGFYVAEAAGERFAATDFEPTDARSAFPCFDEPALKATFSVTAIVDAKLMAVANRPVERETIDAKTQKKIVHFAVTPPLSTYLVALAVGPFERKERKVGAVTVGVIARHGMAQFGDWALDVAEQTLPLFEKYFGIAYAYGPKLDFVAIPDFQAGAMENAGAIFFRESRLLYPPSGTIEQKRMIAAVIVHEVAHQWFGDLVTMKWWDDLWLNEAFASWMQLRTVDEWQPTWKTWLGFQTDEMSAMRADSFKATHPIRVPVESPEDVNASFDRITYTKGAAVIRMLEEQLGPAVFQRGIQRYVRTHAEHNATAEDLWAALAAESGKPVVSWARTWIEVPGHPVVVVTPSSVEQSRFTIGPEGQSALWPIDLQPLPSGAPLQLTALRMPTPLVLPVPSAFVRAELDAAARKSLLALRDGKAQWLAQPAQAHYRLALLADAWDVAFAGRAPLDDYFALLDALHPESEYFVLSETFDRLEQIRDRFTDDKNAALQNRVRKIFAGTSDDEQTRVLKWEAQARLARTPAALAGLQAKIDDAFGKEVPSATPTLFEAELRTYIEVYGLPGDKWDRYLAWLRNTKSAAMHEQLLYALTFARDSATIDRVVALGLTDSVAAQDRPRFYSHLFLHVPTQRATWQFVTTHLAALSSKIPEFAFQRIAGGMANLCGGAEAEALRHFFAQPENSVRGSKRVLDRAAVNISACGDFITHNQKSVRDWLKPH